MIIKLLIMRSDDEPQEKKGAANDQLTATPLLGPLALVCWVASLFAPAMSVPQGWIPGWELAAKGALIFPLGLLFSPLLALSVWTNLVFLSNLRRLHLAGKSGAKEAKADWVGGALLFNLLAMSSGGAGKQPVLGDIGRYPAMWLWLLSFLLLCMAIMRSEQMQSGGKWRLDRWKAAAIACSLPCVIGLVMQFRMYESTLVKRSMIDVESIEVRRTGVPARRYPLLETGYLHKSKYKFLVVDGVVHEALPNGEWMERPTGRAARYLVHEVVESYRMDSEGPGAVLRSKITIQDTFNGELIASKTFYDGMIEDGHGWVGDHALKFVQSVLVPTTEPSLVSSREALASRQLESHAKLNEGTGKRQIVDCPGTVKLVDAQWHKVVTPGWTLNASSNVRGVACSANAVYVAMVNGATVDVDVIHLDGRVLRQGRTVVTRQHNDYGIREIFQRDGAWIFRVAAFSGRTEAAGNPAVGFDVTVPLVPD